MKRRLCRQKLVIFALAVTLPVLALSASGLRGTILENLGFERGEVAWGMWGDSDIRDEFYGLEAHEGNNFIRLWSRSGWWQDFPTEKGKKYQVEAFVASAGKDALWGDAYGELKVEWRDKSERDVEISTPKSLKFDLAGGHDKKIKPDTWTRLALPVARAPVGATHGRVLVTIWTEGGETGGGCVLFDDISIREVPGP